VTRTFFVEGDREMRGRKRILSITAILLLVLIVSAVFASGVVDISKFSLINAPGTVEPASSTALVFVDPAYVNDATKQSGSKFTVHVNISGASDLYTWHVNVTFNKNILSVSKIFPGEFLRRSPNLTASEVLPGGFVINSTDNTKGYSGFAESILGTITGQTGNGRLASIEFLVVGYGSTDLTISLTGILATTLLSSTGGAITFTTTNGYFRNKYGGDVNGDRWVTSADFSVLQGAYGSSKGQPAYNREADFNLDGYITSADFSVLQGNYGKYFP